MKWSALFSHCGLVLCLLAGFLVSCSEPGPEPVIRINCGGPSLTVWGGMNWSPDTPFTKEGSPREMGFRAKDCRTGGIAKAGPPNLYTTVRGGSEFRYEFPDLPEGFYRVLLHFVDAKRGNHHRMDIWVGGVRVLRDFSPEESAMAPLVPTVSESIIKVVNGDGLVIRGDKTTGDEVFISGIEIYEAEVTAHLTPHLEPSASVPQAEIARRLRSAAGGPIRLVWTRTEHVDDPFQKKSTGELWGFDTEDAKGERPILKTLGSYARPTLTTDGNQVVYSDLRHGTCHVVPFGGGEPTKIADGYAGDVWKDPATGIEWVYVREGRRKTTGPVRRHRLDQPEVAEMVWNATESGQEFISYLQISGDGRRAAEVFPYPKAGVADLASADFTQLQRGCWPGVAPDSSERSWVFHGSHSALSIFDTPTSPVRNVPLNTIPEFPGRSVFHPRWSNDAAFLTVTAPEWQAETELYLGQFDPAFTKIGTWIRVTYNEVPDYFGDAWLARAAGGISAGQLPTGSAGPAPPPSPPLWSGLVYSWVNADEKNEVRDAAGKMIRTCSLNLQGKAVWTRWFAAALRGGTFSADGPGMAAATEATSATGAASVALSLLPTQEQSERTVLHWEGRFRLEQRGLQLWLVGPDGAGSELGSLEIGKSQHWIVSLASEGTWKAWREGSPAATGTLPHDWSTRVTTAALIGGASAIESGETWHGEIEDLRLFDRALEDPTVAALTADAQEHRKDRTALPATEVQATLISAAAPAVPAEIAPYRRSLAVCLYEIKAVQSGSLAVGDRILVLHWSVLGGKQTSPLPRPGESRLLRLEELEHHPEIDGEHSTSDTDEFLPRYLDVGPLP